MKLSISSNRSNFLFYKFDHKQIFKDVVFCLVFILDGWQVNRTWNNLPKRFRIKCGTI